MLNVNDHAVRLVLDDNNLPDSGTFINSCLKDLKKVKMLKICLEANENYRDIYAKISGEISYHDPVIGYEAQLEKIDAPFEKLMNLESLDLSSLGLTTLPGGISELAHLKILDISRNQINLEDYFDDLVRIKSLRVLKIYGLPLSDDLLLKINLLDHIDIRYSRIHFLNEIDQHFRKSIYQTNNPVSIDTIDMNDIATNVLSFYPRKDQQLPFKGSELLNSIIKNKNQQIVASRNENWVQVIDELKGVFGDNSVIDVGYNQYPYLHFIILMEEEKTKSLDSKKLLHFYFSLLHDSYTSFFSLSITLKGINPKQGKVHRTYWFDPSISVNNRDILAFQQVRSIVKNRLPDYQTIPIEKLLSYKVDSHLPYDEDNQKVDINYCLFDFLFANLPKADQFLK